jgi:hypothetical protein
MAKAETTTTRAPRGAKPVAQAFFTALESIPEAMRSAVAKAAQAMIRDEFKMQREKIKAAALKAKAKAPAAAKPAPKKAAAKSKSVPVAKAAPAKRGTRKQVSVPAAA